MIYDMTAGELAERAGFVAEVGAELQTFRLPTGQWCRPGTLRLISAGGIGYTAKWLQRDPRVPYLFGVAVDRLRYVADDLGDRALQIVVWGESETQLVTVPLDTPLRIDVDVQP